MTTILDYKRQFEVAVPKAGAVLQHIGDVFELPDVDTVVTGAQGWIQFVGSSNLMNDLCWIAGKKAIVETGWMCTTKSQVKLWTDRYLTPEDQFLAEKSVVVILKDGRSIQHQLA